MSSKCVFQMGLCLLILASLVSLALAQWASVESMGQPRYGVMAVAAQGKVYAFGGAWRSWEGPYYEWPLTYSEVYDPTENAWTTIRELPVPLSQGDPVYLNDRIYIPGGFTGSGGGDGLATMPNIFYRIDQNNYDIHTSTDASYAYQAVALDGYLYKIGGIDLESGAVLDSLRRFDPSRSTWSDLAPMNEPRASFGAGALAGKIYVVGGVQSPNTAEVYDPERDEWAYIAEPPGGFVYGAAAACSGLLVISHGDSPQDTAWGYDPEKDEWIELPKWITGQRR